jgi:ABC-type antimicrobial peptide transport system permease subunit
MTMRQGIRMAGIGIAIGLPAAIVLTKTMSSVLYNLLVLDPLWFAALTALLASSAVAASYVPARRAARVDPITALRNE